MSLFSGDASEVYQLAGDLSQIGVKSVPVLRGVMGEAGKALEGQWRSNATATSGTHGRYYPNAIDSELTLDLGGVSVDVGPNAAKKQGSMGKGFEFGSVNQPPHLDGAKALESMEPRVEAIIDATVGHLFG